MIGPGLRLPSGISALVETIMPSLKQHVDLLYLTTVEQRSLKDSGRFSIWNMALILSQYVRFFRALFHNRPDIIHLHTSQGLAWLKDSFFVLVGKAYACHVVLHVHAADFGALYGQWPRPVKGYTRRIMRMADVVIAVSTEWEKRLADIVPSNQVHVFRNCVAVDAVPRRHTYASRNEAKALFLGSVGPRKGAFDLLEAMGLLKLKDCFLHLLVAGYEERKGDLLRARKRLEELHLEGMCELVGTVHGDRKTQLLTEATMFVLPSHHEGLPIAILEALAAGLAVVATPVGGIPEVVRDGYNGFLVNPGDVQALAEKLTLLTTTPHLCEVMGQRSRELAEKEFDAKVYSKRLVDLYSSWMGVR
jgi:glycosyltransferase involved in cell wall biosynthesis